MEALLLRQFATASPTDLRIRIRAQLDGYFIPRGSSAASIFEDERLKI
jgi:hypothetical protein